MEDGASAPAPVRLGVLAIGSETGMLVGIAWALLVVAPLTLAGSLLGLVVEPRAEVAAIAAAAAALTAAAWRITRLGLVVRPEGLTRRGFLHVRWIPAGEILELAIEPKHMNILTTWTGPYREMVQGVIRLRGGERVTSPALVGGVKRVYWNNIAPDAQHLERRMAILRSVLEVADPPPRISRNRNGRTVTSRVRDSFPTT